MTDLPELLDSERIQCGCDIRSKKRALQTVAELLGASLRSKQAAEHGDDDEASDSDAVPPIADMDILDALITRERLGSTGIGHGIALPHSRQAGIDEPLAALITLNEGVDFESIDGEPVDVVLGLLVPEDCNDAHLQILADLARRFSDPAFRQRLRESESGDELMQRLDAVPAS